jgi:hypothetical protein
VADRTPVREVVESLVRDHRRYFPDQAQAPAVASVTVLTRPLSELARVRLQFGTTARTLYVKIPTRTIGGVEGLRRKARLEFETLSWLHEAFRGDRTHAVVRPVAFFPESSAVVTEAGQGVNLQRLLKRRLAAWRSGRDLPVLEEHCRRAGRWLARFQAITAQPAPEPPAWDAFFRRLRADLDACVTAGFAAESGRALLAACEEELAQVGGRPVTMAGSHPDFQPDNVLVSPGGVTVLDFASFHHAPVWADLMRFPVSVAFFSRWPGYPRNRIDRLIQAYFAGYGAEATADDPGARLYALRWMLKLAAASCRPSARPLAGLRRRWALTFLAGWPDTVDRLGALARPTAAADPALVGKLP